MGRRESRDAAVKVMFGYDFVNDGKLDNTHLESMITKYLENSEEYKPQAVETEYLTNVVNGINENLTRIDDLIKQYAQNWEIERMAKVDIAILRVAIYEMIFREDIPSSVSINEAVEMSKKYSYEDASSFINGILGGVFDELKSNEDK